MRNNTPAMRDIRLSFKKASSMPEPQIPIAVAQINQIASNLGGAQVYG
jgi:hypothetical protein